jgi:hypothetical protein
LPRPRPHQLPARLSKKASCRYSTARTSQAGRRIPGNGATGTSRRASSSAPARLSTARSRSGVRWNAPAVVSVENLAVRPIPIDQDRHQDVVIGEVVPEVERSGATVAIYHQRRRPGQAVNKVGQAVRWMEAPTWLLVAPLCPWRFTHNKGCAAVGRRGPAAGEAGAAGTKDCGGQAGGGGDQRLRGTGRGRRGPKIAGAGPGAGGGGPGAAGGAGGGGRGREARFGLVRLATSCPLILVWRAPVFCPDREPPAPRSTPVKLVAPASRLTLQHHGNPLIAGPSGGRSSGRPRLPAPRGAGEALAGPGSSLVNRADLTPLPPVYRLITGTATLPGAVLAGPCCLSDGRSSWGCAASSNPASGSLKQQRSGFLPGEAFLRKFLCFSYFNALSYRYSLQYYLYLGEAGH